MIDPHRLRQQAEEKLARTPKDGVSHSPEETRNILHELRVHQIELEMQNDELRRAQEDQDVSRARYFDLYDMAPVGYCTLSETGLILEANLTAATLLGVPRGELARKPITRFIHQEDQDIYYRHRKLLSETGEPQSCEFRMQRPDAAVFWAHLRATASQDDGKAPTCRIVLTDITARKRNEEALRVSEERYRSILNASPDGIVIVDIDGFIRMASPRSAELAGVDQADDIFGQPVIGFVAPEDRERASAHLLLLFQGQALGALEYRGVRADGSTYDMEVTADSIRDAGGRPTQLVIMIRDISPRKQAEKEILALSKFPLENPNPVLRIARGGEILFTNPPGLALLAAWNTEVGGKAPEKWQTRIQEALESNQSKSGIEEEVAGTILSMTLAPVPEAGYANVYALDITARKQAEEQMAKRMDELRRWQTVTLGREGRNAELKREVNALAARLGQPPPYGSVEAK